MDIKAKIEEIVLKLKKDESLMKSFQKDPIKTVEGLLGVNLPDEQLKPLVDGVKAKLNLDSLSGVVGGLGSLLGKK